MRMFPLITGAMMILFTSTVSAQDSTKVSAQDSISVSTQDSTKVSAPDSTTASAPDSAKQVDYMHPVVIMETNKGTMEITLDAEKAPVTVANFLSYVAETFYDSTIFHRVIPGFMIQGGGFTTNMAQKPTKAPIKNEAANGLRNMRGTIAMARTNVVNSATSQFFINHADNDFLNYRNDTPQGYGYAVFGKVTKGIEVADKIAAVSTGIHPASGMQDVPREPVVILSVRVKK